MSVTIFSARSLPMPSISVRLRSASALIAASDSEMMRDLPRRVAIGPHAERIRALEVQDVGDLLEDAGDLGVGHSVGLTGGNARL